MSQKHYSDFNSSVVPEIEYVHDGSKVKHTFSKFDYDLFDEEKYVVEKVIRVKRIASANKNERWNIFENNKIVFVLEGSKVSKKEKEYLRTPNGFSFLICQGKTGIKSLAGLRKELKKVIEK